MKRILQTHWLEVICLIVISGFTYLPHINELTYYRDDWYFLYNALVRGPEALIQLALHTRPIRGPLYALYFSLFGLNPLPYHITMWLTRLAGGIGALWLFRLLWPKPRRVSFFLALLFLLFPGFLWWVAGFEFQPYVLSVGLQVFSIAFTIKAVSADTTLKKTTWTMAAILSGLTYLALVEYAIGMELFRFLCVYVYIKKQNGADGWSLLAKKSMRASDFHFLIPLLFLIWYIFLFDNWRSAQDAGTQLSVLISSPLTLIWRFVDIFRSLLNVSLFAWVVPFYQNFYNNRLSDILLGLIFAALALALLVKADSIQRRTDADDGDGDNDVPEALSKELLWVGLLGAFGGVLPVVLANRVITFERITQYTLPASLAAVLFLSGLIYSVFPLVLRNAIFYSLVVLAVLTHHGLAAQAVTEEKTISNFWWQVSWRAPQLKAGTTLAVIYPDIYYAEGNDVVWGPANFIYFQNSQINMPVNVPIAASRMEADSMLDIINGRKDFQQVDLVIKNISMNYDYENLLLISQPSLQSCVHVIDPRWPDLSVNDQPLVHASYKNSVVENVIPAGKGPALLEHSFGTELPHNWCFFYEKADLARQQMDWKEVARLGEQALKMGLHPNDQIEWMPFLQAYAALNNLPRVKELSRRINTEAFYKQQACRNLNTMIELGYALSIDMQAEADALFCKRP